jgi:hypothetical protein
MTVFLDKTTLLLEFHEKAFQCGTVTDAGRVDKPPAAGR